MGAPLQFQRRASLLVRRRDGTGSIMKRQLLPEVEFVPAPTGFDYERLLAQVRKQIQDETRAIKGLVVNTASNIIQIGLRLQLVRDCIGRSHFQQWLRQEFRWSQSIASNYMRAAAVFGDVDCLDRFQPSALYVLARHKASGAARTEALTRARAGEVITKASAETIIRKYCATPSYHESNVVSDIRGSLRRIQSRVEMLTPDEMKQIAEQVIGLLAKLESPEGPPATKF